MRPGLRGALEGGEVLGWGSCLAGLLMPKTSIPADLYAVLMDLRQLRYLVALDEERHFTRAAQREHIAQPALSQQIRRLEEEVGLALVERTTRRVALTEAGVCLVARARRVLAEIDGAYAELAALSGVQSG